MKVNLIFLWSQFRARETSTAIQRKFYHSALGFFLERETQNQWKRFHMSSDILFVLSLIVPWYIIDILAITLSYIGSVMYRDVKKCVGGFSYKWKGNQLDKKFETILTLRPMPPPPRTQLPNVYCNFANEAGQRCRKKETIFITKYLTQKHVHVGF